jgi:predicted RND superfamily exporter protein
MYRSLLERGWLWIVLVFAAAAGVLGTFLPRVTVDASTSLLLDEHDPDLTYYARSRRMWPSDDEFAIFCCRRADWFTPESLEVLREVQKDLSDATVVPNVRKVVSLLDIPLLRSGGSVFAPPTIESKGTDLAKAREELTNHAVARGTLISADGRDTCLLVYLEQPPDYEAMDRERNEALENHDDAKVAQLDPKYEVLRADLRARRRALVLGVRAVAAKWSPKMDGPIRLSGLPFINLSLIEFVTNDVNVFGVLSFSLFAAAFAVIYRRLRWTFFPIVTCLLPVVLMLGLMAALDWKLTVITANLPLLLFVLMLPFTVYFIERYRERRAKSAAEPHLGTTAGAAGDVWVPCLYSCTTIMAGFASLLTSGVKPVWWFGLMMTIGLAVGLAGVFLFLPAATSRLTAVEDPRATADPRPHSFMRVLERCVLAAPAVLGGIGLALYLGGAFACTKLTVENKFIDYFWPDGNPFMRVVRTDPNAGETYRGLEYIDQHMGGTTPLDIMLTSKTPGFFKTKDGVAAIRAASEFVTSKDNENVVGSVTSLATLIDEARKAPMLSKATDTAVLAMGERFPKLKPLILDVATPDYSTARILVRFRETSPTLHRKQFLDALRADLGKRPEVAALCPVDDRGVRHQVTGVFLLYSNMLESLLAGHKETFWTVILAISLMLMTLFGFRRPLVQVPVAVGLSVVLFFVPTYVRDVVGLSAAAAALTSLVLALTLRLDERLAKNGHPRVAAFVHTLATSVVVHVPEILPAVVVLGVMGVVGIPLDLITVTIAAISMGVGIDAAIQYTVRYRLELAAAGGDRRAAVTRSHATIGRSIWIATSIMVAGFAVMAFSDFVPTVYFGLFNALAMVIGQFAALTVLPSLFLLTGLPRR